MADIGKKYYAQCKKVLHEYKLSHLITEDTNSELSGKLNIVCSREIAQSLIYPTMATFLEQHPNIVTNVTLKKHPEEAITNNFDLAIGYELSEIFNNYCYQKQKQLLIYYPNIKPTPKKITHYKNYLFQQQKA